MNIKTLFFFIGAFMALLPAHEASAQTYRVASGMSAQGNVTYKEVFEFDYVDVKPEFPGGGSSLISYINSNRRYPADAYSRGIEGRVTCSFVVNADGKVSNITVVRGVEPSLNREAIRLLSQMPSWSPGKIKNHNVPVRVICAVPFRK